MKPLLSAFVATVLLTGVVYAAVATEALVDRPLAVLGMLLIGVGMVRHHRERERPVRVAAQTTPPRPNRR